MGLYPDGVEAPETSVTTEAPRSAIKGSSLRMALTVPALWLIGTSYLISAISRNGIIHNQVPYLEDIGFPITTAAAALGTVGLGSAIGKIVFGWLCDRIAAKHAWGIALGLQVVSVIIFMSVGPTSPLTAIWLYAITMGVGRGGWLPTMSMLVSTTFGLASYGTIFGLGILLQNIGVSTGPLIAGYMYDIMGTYYWFFIISIILFVGAIPPILAVRRHKST